MKYLLVLVIIIGIVTYIFLGSPKPGDADAPLTNRREDAWQRIAFLEAQRRDLLVRAKCLGSGSSRSRSAATGVYAAGYRDGFTQGYFAGTFQSTGQAPDALFAVRTP